MSNKELDKSSIMTNKIARNMKTQASNFKELRGGESPKVYAFIDESYCSVVELAKELYK